MSNYKVTKKEKRLVRHKRVRAKVSGTAERPRLSVFKSNKFIYGQLINDVAGKTLVAVSSKNQKGEGLVIKAKLVGQAIAKLSLEKGIKKVVFDRSGYVYTGVILAFADGAREGGLNF